MNLTGAGFVAGSGAQAGLLTGDMAYGRWFKVPSRYQFWAQCLTVLPCSIVAAFVFQQIHAAKPSQCQGFPMKWRPPDALDICAGLRHAAGLPPPRRRTISILSG